MPSSGKPLALVLKVVLILTTQTFRHSDPKDEKEPMGKVKWSLDLDQEIVKTA